jgi:hypothetical protein
MVVQRDQHFIFGLQPHALSDQITSFARVPHDGDLFVIGLDIARNAAADDLGKSLYCSRFWKAGFAWKSASCR